MIKDLAGIYHAECLTYCRELLELQKKAEEVSNILLQLLYSFHFEEGPCFHLCLVKFMLQGIIETYYFVLNCSDLIVNL